MVQVVLVQFKASTHKERGRPRDWRLGPMKVQQQRRDASHDTPCLHPKSFAGRKRLQVAKRREAAWAGVLDFLFRLRNTLASIVTRACTGRFSINQLLNPFGRSAKPSFFGNKRTVLATPCS